MKKEHISNAVIRRLPRYYRYLDELYAKGVIRISSGMLGESMGVTASQIRQDLNCFGKFGQQGYGYNIVELRAEIGHILGVDVKSRVVLVGVGNLGHALLRNFDFALAGFSMDTAFDSSPEQIGKTINGINVCSVDEMEKYFQTYHPSVAILTVPQNVAQSVTDKLVLLGVQGIWNFTNVELQTSEAVFVEDVHFADSLLTLSYRISREAEQGKI